jgi:hypothetical protein
MTIQITAYHFFQYDSLVVHIIDLLLEFLTTLGIFTKQLKELSTFRRKPITIRTVLKANQASVHNLGQISTQKPIAQIGSIHDLRLFGAITSYRQYVSYDAQLIPILSHPVPQTIQTDEKI